MMSNVSLKTKASYDLPDFVQDNYKTFSTFIDSYHAWLDINQADIKSLSDIDTTIQSFITNFRKEVDYKEIKFPNIDERFLLRNIKELYLSKGTEESYKTLFKLLFNKDIVIKYPDQMTLKLSDGKWSQLSSIFVEAETGEADGLRDRNVKITTHSSGQSKNVTVEKVILRRTGGGVSTVQLASGGSGYTAPTVTFSGNGTGAVGRAVVEFGVITAILIDSPGIGYVSAPTITISGSHTTSAVVSEVRMYFMPDIYEFNIDKHYYGTIEIDDIVTFDTFVGRILPTINSSQIIDSGKNFRIGQTFKIDTIFGRGATVKVSKLTPNINGVAELKFIEFGYGYVSDFTSANLIPPNISQYNSNNSWSGINNASPKSATGLIHEQVKVDPSGGYILNDNYSVGHLIDEGSVFGPIDAQITINNIVNSSGDIFVADNGIITLNGTWGFTGAPHDSGVYSTDYAGELVREFYSSNEYNGDRANGAHVLFKIGAVCKYPGYYNSSDGMTSDVNKIQDSFLYQKYSYIIQVDEKLETYRDIVKSSIHPAGIALFGEYSIHNNFYAPIKLTALLSIFAVSHADSASFSDLNIFNIGKIVNDDSYLLYGTKNDRTLLNYGNTDDSLIRWFNMTKVINDPNDFIAPSKTGNQIITAFSDYSGTVLGAVRATSVAHGLVGTVSEFISSVGAYNGVYMVTVIDADHFYFTATWSSSSTGWIYPTGWVSDNPNVFILGANKYETVSTSVSQTIDSNYGIFDAITLNALNYLDYVTIWLNGDGLRLSDNIGISDINNKDSTVTVLGESTFGTIEWVTVIKNIYMIPSDLANYVLGDWVSGADSTVGITIVTSPIDAPITLNNMNMSTGAVTINSVVTISNICVWMLN